MFNNHPTKSQLRLEQEQKIKQFLARGGKIQQVRPGATGLIDGKYKSRHIHLHSQHKTRTPIPEVVAAIDARRCSKQAPATAKQTMPKRQRKVIFDDFGEPIRTVWVDK